MTGFRQRIEPTWRTGRAVGVTQVIPDGCRDLIVWSDHQGRLRITISALDDRPRWVHYGGKEEAIGWRLEPGSTVSERRLLEVASEIRAPLDFATTIHDIAGRAPNTSEALAVCGTPCSIASSASTLGVSVRTLRRHLVRHTGRPPSWWRSLARVRRAARRVDTEDLLEVALTEGFSDQAHMTREFRRWLDCTPGAPTPDARRAVWSTGYDPMGVPSSTMKPSGERTYATV